MKIKLALFACICCSNLWAQQKPDMSMAKQQMANAQHLLDSIKKANPEMQKQLDAYKKMQPGIQIKLDSVHRNSPATGLKDGNLADGPSLPAMPDFDKLANTVGQSMQSIDKYQSNIAASNKKGLPQKSATPFTAKTTNETEILKWANTMYLVAKNKAGTFLEPTLKHAYYDTSQNPASTGMIMIAAGLPKCAGQYLVCKYLIEHPKNAMALNDLGIFMRIEKDYPKAIALFLYAAQLNDTSVEIKTNLGWAYAYAGDFNKAKSYFNKVIEIYPYYGSALEGLSLIAYQEGDRQTLWKNLAKQLYNNSKTGGLGIGAPSGQMASFCGGVLTEEEMKKMTGENGSGADNNTFDNPNGANPEDQSDEKNIDPDEDIDYPSYEPDFHSDMKDISMKRSIQVVSEFSKAMQKDLDYLNSLLAKLPKPMQFVNSDGDLETIYNYDNDAHYIFFSKMHQEYEKRRARIFSASRDKVSRALLTLTATYNGVVAAFGKALEPCSKDPDCMLNDECGCIRSVKCDYLPRIAATLKNFGMSIGDITTSAFEKTDDLNYWYINASSPMLQYISEPNWNKYLNAVREADIRRSKLILMQMYQQIIGVAESYVKQGEAMQPKDGECVFEARIPEQSIKSKYRDLKTLAPPCKDFSNKHLEGTGGKLDAGLVKYEDNCAHTRLSIRIFKMGSEIGGDGAKVGAETEVSRFWETMKSKYVGEDITRTGIELHSKVSAEIGGSATDGFKITTIKASAEIKAEMETTVDFFRAWDANGKEIKRGVMFDASATVSGKAGVNVGISKETLGVDKAKTDILNQGFEKGAHASGEYAAVMGPDGSVGDYGFSNMSINKTNK